MVTAAEYRRTAGAIPNLAKLCMRFAESEASKSDRFCMPVTPLAEVANTRA
jgi:hypothetical protein